MHVLILGGTHEAALLARELAATPGVTVTTAMAGRTAEPIAPAGRLHIGHFGGAEGLADYLRRDGVDVLVDATHPFAQAISARAAKAAADTGISRVALDRPAWPRTREDCWYIVEDAHAAARLSARLGGCQFLAIGRQGLAAFAENADVCYLIRTVDKMPDASFWPNATVINERGPFTVAGELALMRRYGITAVVTKASGGPGAYAKIAAARRLRLPVIMVARPEPPPPPRRPTVAAVVAWLRRGGSAEAA